jgi:hypothetical protein
MLSARTMNLHGRRSSSMSEAYDADASHSEPQSSDETLRLRSTGLIVVLLLMKSCLTVRQRQASAQERYSAFVQAGIGNPSIWESLQAQSLLGVEGFAEGLRHLVVEKQQIREIPKGQRFVGRPSLEKLFSTRSPGKASRDRHFKFLPHHFLSD